MRSFRTWFVLLIAVLLAAPVFAQTRGNGRINGKVVDETNKPIVDVEVKAVKAGESQVFATKTDKKGTVMLRHKRDRIFDSTCMFFDQKKRRCGVYEARPGVCRKYPDAVKCGYYEFLKFEREQQGDEKMVALT